MVIETLSVFGSICSIYSVFKDKGKKDKNYLDNYAKGIIAIDYFKVAHTISQELREFCLTLRTDNLLNQSSTSSGTFQYNFNELMDKVLRFNGFSGVFQEDIFVPKTITTTEHMSPFIKEMRGVCNATTQIIKYLDIIQPIVTEYHSWHNTWNIGDYTPKKDIPRFIETSEKLENPSRMVLMSSNMAILDSITLFKSTVGLLRE